MRGNEDLDLVHDRQAAVGRREKAHSPLVHARHDERAVRDQAVSPLVAEAPEHRRLGHRDDLDPHRRNGLNDRFVDGKLPDHVRAPGELARDVPGWSIGNMNDIRRRSAVAPSVVPVNLT